MKKGILFALLCSMLTLFFTACLPEKNNTLEISLRQGDDYSMVADPLSAASVESKPWARFRPEPFRYKADAEGGSEIPVFVVGGINCPDKLKSIRTVTGLSWETLNARCHGGQAVTSISALDPQFKAPPEWEGVGNVGLRVSGPGFLHPEQTFSEVLQKDNEWVLTQGYTHQKIAEPLLLALESFEKRTQSRLAEVKFKYLEKEYRLSAKPMGGQGSLKILRKVKSLALIQELKGKLAKKQIDRSQYEAELTKVKENEKKNPQFRSGWIGVGTQGSPFNDEIFADYILELYDEKQTRLLVFDAMTPHLIYRYGFYQGGTYRIEPRRVVEVFGIPAESNPCGSKT